MSDMPLVLQLTFAALIGYPLIQSLALWWFVRPAIRDARSVAKALKADPAYIDDIDQLAITRTLQDAWLQPEDLSNLTMPIAAPVAIFVIALNEILGRGASAPKVEHEELEVHIERQILKDSIGYPTDGALWRDKRFWHLRDRVNIASFGRWPICFTLTATAVLAILPIWSVAYGLKRSTLVTLRYLVQSLAGGAKTLHLVSPVSRHV